MDQHPFDWIPVKAPAPENHEPLPIPETAPPGARRRAWLKCAPYVSFACLVLAIVALFATRNGKSATDAAPAPAASVDVLTTLFPMAKGQGVEPELLQMVPIRAKDLTPRQRMQAVRVEDLEKLRGRVRAKRNLAPRQIVYWNDLDLNLSGESKGTAAAPQRPKIFFSGGNGT